MMRAAMPDITKMMRDIIDSQVNIADIGKLYTQQYQDLIANGAKVSVPVIPKLEVPRFEFPALKLDYSSLFPDFAAVQPGVWDQLRASIDLIQNLQRDQFADIIKQAKNAQAMVRASLPPNWRDDEIFIPADLEAMLLDEGLALAWVPPTAVVKKIFNASSAQERRRILGSHWRTITKACIAELEAIEAPALREHIEFALDAATTLLANNPRPAQALSANLLDTVLRQSFDNKDHKTITGRKARLDIDEYPIRVAIVLGGIWGSFGEFWTKNGDKIPRQYTRHGSAHGVSRRQYSRINSMLALMHVVSLLRLLENDLADS